jgi:hypothetical protein
MNAGLRKIALFGSIVLSLSAVGFYQVMPTVTNEGYQPEQPIPFSHKLHAGQYKMDCRYCHTSAYKSASAGVPSLSTCMNCHTVVKTDSPYIQRMQKLYAEGKPVEWLRVHELPDHVHFNHKRHITKGVQCETCHGNVAGMDRVYQDQVMNMGWCLNCHRGFETPKYLKKKIHPEQPDSKEPVAPFNCNTCHY